MFVEHRNFDNQFAEVLGLPQNDPRYVRDRAVIQEIARIPSLDPYLLRERLRRMQFKIARCYFEMTEADLNRMSAHVSAEISKLVQLAFESEGYQTARLSNRLAEMLLQDEDSDQLSPLRATLKLSKSEYREGMFGWKGFLYYKWRAKSVQDDLPAIAKEMLSVRILQAMPEDQAFMNKVRERIIHRLGIAAGQVKQALAQYDLAYDELVKNGDPTSFRKFLLSAPSRFFDTGEHLAALSHICSFWRFRFQPGAARTIEVEEAYELFQQFESSLGGSDMPQRRPNAA